MTRRSVVLTTALLKKMTRLDYKFTYMFRDGFVVKKGFLTSAVLIPKQSLMIH